MEDALSASIRHVEVRANNSSCSLRNALLAMTPAKTPDTSVLESPLRGAAAALQALDPLARALSDVPIIKPRALSALIGRPGFN